jgi:signal transduction histidine kinase
MRTQMWQRSSDPEAASRSSAVILQEIDRLDTIIDRLLYFARPIQLQRQVIALDDLCTVVAFTWAEKETARGVRIDCETSSQSIVIADRGRLLQVLDNLLENAIQATHQSTQIGIVTIATAQENGFARIDIADNGPGFTASSLDHAMDPFYTTKDSGTGLGLHLLRDRAGPRRRTPPRQPPRRRRRRNTPASLERWGARYAKTAR